MIATRIELIMIGKPVLKNSPNVILYPCCSEIPAATKLQLAPTRDPLPPKQLPKASL